MMTVNKDMKTSNCLTTIAIEIDGIKIKEPLYLEDDINEFS